MGRAPCCAKVGLRRGPWTQREDRLLKSFIQVHGEGDWKYLPQKAGLLRCGKSCRLRWRNYLRPDIKRGNITPDEEDLIIRLHSLLGNRWSLIAGRLPGRTDNEIKNYWNTRMRKKLNPLSFSNSPRPHPQVVKAHHPKPERATPFSCKGSMGRGGEGAGSSAPQLHESLSHGFCDDRVVDVGLEDGYDHVVGDCDRDFVDGLEFAYQSTFVPTIDLEMIYGELSQLLNI